MEVGPSPAGGTGAEAAASSSWGPQAGQLLAGSHFTVPPSWPRQSLTLAACPSEPVCLWLLFPRTW